MTKTGWTILGIVTLVIIIGVSVYFFTDDTDYFGGTATTTNNGSLTGGPDNIVYCTMDAKLCPDGSYVGRIPPNCEFAACPGATSSPSGNLRL